MKLVYSAGPVEIWELMEDYGPDYYVYRDGTLLRVCPSIGMAHEIAA